MAPKAGSKCKGKETIHGESPIRYDNSSYPSQEAFDRYSTRTITFGRVINFSHLVFIGFNQLIRRMRWLTFARLSNPSYPSLIQHFYASLSRPHKQRLYLIATTGDIEIELEPSSMCRILGVNNEGDEVYDTKTWPILSNFDPQRALKHLCKLGSWLPKPKSKDLTLQAILLLLFV